MLAETLTFLRRHLDEQLRVRLDGSQDDAAGDKVVFLDGDKLDPISFQMNAVTALLINIEEERTLRAADLHSRQAEDGSRQRIQPDIRLILYVLFVARFKKYESAWQHLSLIVEHLQSTRVFEPATAPALPEGVERLILELVTLGFAEQNEIWSALRTTHHPSLLYRVKLVALRDQRPTEPPVITEAEHTLRRRT
jgi:hypothetical protein